MMSPPMLYVFVAWLLPVAVIPIACLIAISYARHKGRFGLTTLIILSITAPMFGQSVYVFVAEPFLRNTAPAFGVGFGVFAGACVTSMAVMLITNSLAVYLFAFCASVAAGGVAYVLDMPCTMGEGQCTFNAIVAGAVVWHGVTFAGLFYWAVRERRNNTKLCYYCDYELTDLEDPICPECGAAFKPPVRGERSNA